MATRWFKRLADVPKLAYEVVPEVDCTKLPGYDLEPEISVYEFEGKEHRSLRWANSSSISPAAGHTLDSQTADASPQALLRRLEEALELPGELLDYHFAIQTCATSIYKMSPKHPEVLQDVERLCGLDIELVEAYPEIIEFEPGKRFRVSTFESLLHLYEREGYLHEAMEVAERGLRCGQDLSGRLEDLRARLAAMEAEGTD